jgi:hypothetical protein
MTATRGKEHPGAAAAFSVHFSYNFLVSRLISPISAIKNFFKPTLWHFQSHAHSLPQVIWNWLSSTSAKYNIASNEHNRFLYKNWTLFLNFM